MDWDSNRYLEAYFAVPMIGAVLMMVNVRLAPEQIAYTLNHSGARVILANREFLPLLDAIDEQLPDLRTRILLDDAGGPLPPASPPSTKRGCAVPRRSVASGLRREHPCHGVLHHRHHRPAQGVYFSHRQLVLHSLAAMAALGSAPARAACTATMSTCRSPRCSMCTPGACPTWPR
jgi:fatty-acyl-CoA synthase